MADALDQLSRPDSGVAGKPTQETGVPAPTEVPGAAYPAAATSPLLGRRNGVADASQEGARARDLATEAFTSKAFVDRKVAEQTKNLWERMTRLEEENQTLRDDKQCLEKQLVHANAEVKDSLAVSAEKAAECKNLRLKLEDKERDLSHEKKRYQQQSVDYECLRTEKQKLQKKVERLEKENAELTRQVEELRAELERVSQGLTNVQDQLRQQGNAYELTAGMVACEAERAVMMHVWRDCDKGDYRIKDYNKLRRFVKKLTDNLGELVKNDFDPYDHGLCDAECAKENFANPQMEYTRRAIRAKLDGVERMFEHLANDILDAKNEDTKFNRLSVETTREGKMNTADVKKLSDRYAQRDSHGDREMHLILLRLQDAFDSYVTG